MATSDQMGSQPATGDGGADAPGALGLVEELINSVELEDGPDELADPGSAARWLTAHGLLPRGRKVTEPERRSLVELREALRALALAHNGAPSDAAATRTLNRLAAACPLVVRVDADGRATLAPAGSGVEAAVATVLAAVQGAVADGTWHRLKACRQHTCRWAFYDRSRNRSGTWCDMAVCGNRNKVRSFRRRHAGD
jgi:predicted RNA-binding Zn ribbon-like protein